MVICLAVWHQVFGLVVPLYKVWFKRATYLQHGNWKHRKVSTMISKSLKTPLEDSNIQENQVTYAIPYSLFLIDVSSLFHERIHTYYVVHPLKIVTLHPAHACPKSLEKAFKSSSSFSFTLLLLCL